MKLYDFFKTLKNTYFEELYIDGYEASWSEYSKKLHLMLHEDKVIPDAEIESIEITNSIGEDEYDCGVICSIKTKGGE